MRCRDEYRALLSKINIEKAKYAEKEKEVNDELEAEIQLTTEKIKKWNNRIIIYVFACLIMIAAIYYFLKYFDQILIFLIITLILIAIGFVLLAIQQYFKSHLKKLNNFKMNDEEKERLRENINSLNKQISSLIVSVITLNDHFVELSNTKNEEELYEKWERYTKQTIMAINKKYNYEATYSEYQEYYNEYEHYLLKKERENESTINE